MGGYKWKSKRDATLEVLQSVQTWAIAIGTVVAALATSGLLYFEYQKNSFFDSLPFYQIALLTLFPTIIAVWLIIRVLIEYRHQTLKKERRT
jgi:uncharacterized membrane protein YbhN (UPF0104 family)